VQDADELAGAAIVTRAISVLDIERWKNDFEQIGNGYSMDLLNLECSWCPLEAMRPVSDGSKRFYECPALLGAALAVS
jgi:hypothetical protein